MCSHWKVRVNTPEHLRDIESERGDRHFLGWYMGFFMHSLQFMSWSLCQKAQIGRGGVGEWVVAFLVGVCWALYVTTFKGDCSLARKFLSLRVHVEPENSQFTSESLLQQANHTCGLIMPSLFGAYAYMYFKVMIKSVHCFLALHIGSLGNQIATCMRYCHVLFALAGKCIVVL